MGIFREVLIRAFKETCKLLGWKRKWILLLVFACSTLLGWSYLWLFGQGKTVFGEMNTVTAYAAGLLTTGALSFLFNLFRAPFLIIHEKRREISSLQTEIDELRERI